MDFRGLPRSLHFPYEILAHLRPGRRANPSRLARDPSVVIIFTDHQGYLRYAPVVVEILNRTMVATRSTCGDPDLFDIPALLRSNAEF
jgi:hypothetical protein